MRKAVFALFSLLISFPAFGAMFRVIAVRDSRTIVVAGFDGVQRLVVLRGVDIPRELEAEAFAHLRRIVERSWVLVESNGDVYRSPDVLFVNGEMIRRAWRTATDMTYHGELDLGPREPAVVKPVPRGKTASPSKSPRSGRAPSGRAPSRQKGKQ
jgi:hypothetical protein